MKHIHAEVIKAWLDGKECEYYSPGVKKWYPIDVLYELDHIDVRVKSDPKLKRDITGFIEVNFNFDDRIVYSKQKLIIDGETGELKLTEVIK